MKINSIKLLRNELRGSNVLLRVDYNEPLKISPAKKTKITEDFRIVSSLPTIRYLARYGCRIILIAHLGDDPLADPETKQCYSTKILARRLSKLLGKNVIWTGDIIGKKAKLAVSAMKDGEILMLENLRFNEGEKKNNEEFAGKLADLAKINNGIYVNDAFSVSHRNHASVSAIKKYLPSYAGLQLKNEIINLNKALKPKKPAVAVMGGAKISTKIKLINKLKSSYSQILIGGAMANNFFKARGMEVGKSLISEDDIHLAEKLTEKKLILPLDVIVGPAGKRAGKAVLKKISEVSKEDSINDIGPETIKLYSKYLRQANTIIWNGPLGKFEETKFRNGTLAIARLVSSLSRGKAFGIVGGGETIEALRLTEDMHNVDWVSTGGGAMLAYLGGEDMPGLSGLI
jgi:phosphoglycerate kinase